ncbi:uncharacterized protein PV07_09477 [Cladophialophora immunda]|uniref:Uncharacterized protein n=1 Tax=Cladophialophora immunda TaxID=569365 RepID=A0A0D2AMQ4_9EURO|nr:uncharacterized protein PV07_09477 [Cladophialophora immunda]KIW26377.1 hypothetical protein PV07_09477 [Cladophialophora immunda]
MASNVTRMLPVGASEIRYVQVATKHDKTSYRYTEEHSRNSAPPLKIAKWCGVGRNGPQQNPVWKRKLRGTFREWWQEIIALHVCLLALCAIVLVLYPNQDKPLPKIPFKISINTLLSILSSVIKAAITFVLASGLGQSKWSWLSSDQPLMHLAKYDAASRGALGSLTLLKTTSFRHLLASLGAVIMILVLAVDPVTQDIIHFVDCSTSVQGAVATIPRTNYFDWGPLQTPLIPLSDSVPVGIQSAINSGFFAPGVEVDFTCSTGNCSFPTEYSTLGYCSKCQDISDQIKVVDDNAHGSILSSLPSGLTVNFTSGDNVTLSKMWTFEDSSGYHIQTLVGSYPLAGLEYTGDPLSSPACQNASEKAKASCGGRLAVSCTMYQCVQSFNAVISAGRLSEVPTDVTGPSLNWTQDSYFDTSSILDTKCLSQNESRQLAALGYRIDPASRWLPYDMTFNPDMDYIQYSTFPESLLGHNCLYIFTLGFPTGLQKYLSKFFSGTLTGELNGDGNLVGFDGPQVLQAVYNFGDMTVDSVDSMFQNAAKSLTTYIRQNGASANSAPVTGQVLHYATCLGVKWPLLSFPAALVVLTLAFFIAVLVTTKDFDVWKSSPLALIFHGLYAPSPELRDQDARGGDVLATVGQMEQVSKSLSVKLEQNSNGFVQLVNTRRIPSSVEMVHQD